MKNYYESLSTEELLKKRALGIDYLTPEALETVEEILSRRSVDQSATVEIEDMSVALKAEKRINKKGFIVAAISVILALLLSSLVSNRTKDIVRSGGHEVFLTMFILLSCMGCIWLLFKSLNRENISLNKACRSFDHAELLNQLIIHSIKGDEKEIQEILHKKIDVNKRNEKGFTALMYAASNGKLGVVRILLENGADKDLITGKGNSALSFAIKNGHVAVVKMLS